jgi:peptidyl-dipeptidase Dcp
MNIKDNPLVAKNNDKYNSIPFSKINSTHFIPALKHGISEASDAIDLICTESVKPGFENTIVRFEHAFEILENCVTVFYHYFASIADDSIRALVSDISNINTKFNNDIYLNNDLFIKIKEVYDNKKDLALNSDDQRLLDETYDSFIRSGANLSDSDKKIYRKISERLSQLSPKYSNNVLKATNEINDYWITSSRSLSGIPSNSIEAAKLYAEEKGRPDEWCFTLDTNFGILLKSCDSQQIREDIFRKYGSKCNGGEHDNSDILKEISKLRDQKAKLLSFDTHADYVLDRRMAKSKDNVYKLINDLIEPSYESAKNEYKNISNYALESDNKNSINPWDISYYSDKYKQEKYDFNDECLRPYFKSENVINGVFEVARRLYGLDFKKIDNVDKFDDDVNIYEVSDIEGKYIGLLYEDIYPRSTKRGGAWMNQLKSQGMSTDGMQQPHVTFNCNLTKSTSTKPALLSQGEVRTIFHEFGHCLHGLLTDVKYKSMGGMSVYWDFVELPSQIFENWLLEPDVLNIFAKHYETGESMPVAYIEKINELKTYMAGMSSLRQLQLCKIDMAWHDGYKEVGDVEEYESSVLEDCRIIEHVKGNSVSASFSHIFSGGYSAGYYSYKWAELLEADAFEKFKEEGIFNKDVASSFKNNILSKGNTEHPMNLYVKFRGREPKVDALLKKSGLI